MPHVSSSAGIARCTAQDDVFEGYEIPKGTIVLPNVWFVEGDDAYPRLKRLT